MQYMQYLKIKVSKPGDLPLNWFAELTVALASFGYDVVSAEVVDGPPDEEVPYDPHLGLPFFGNY